MEGPTLLYGPILRVLYVGTRCARPQRVLRPAHHIGSGTSTVTEMMSPSPIPRRLRIFALSGRS